MNFIEKIKFGLNLCFSGKARKNYRNNNLEKKFSKFRLLMLMVVRNEERIIKQNILFHKEMGVDGFIVISHKSTDGTNAILEKLKKEGIILDILYKTTEKHQHAIWSNEMVMLAKLHHADWVIHADADEFFYSKQQNIKKSIFEFDKLNFNVIKVHATSLFPDDREDFLTCPYFVQSFPPPPRGICWQ